MGESVLELVGRTLECCDRLLDRTANSPGLTLAHPDPFRVGDWVLDPTGRTGIVFSITHGDFGLPYVVGYPDTSDVDVFEAESLTLLKRPT